MPKVKVEASDNADGTPFIKGPRKKRNKLSRLEEYDEDPGRVGSQKYQRLADMLETCTAKEAGKSKVFLREFRKGVKRKGIELKAFRQEREEAFKRSQEKFAATFRQLSQHLSGGLNGRLSIPHKEDHPLFRQAQTNTEIHQSLLKQFKLVEEKLNASKLELPVARWKQDKQEIKELLASSGRHGEALVGSVLAPESAGSMVMTQLNECEENQFSKELFRDNRAVLQGETWGHLAEEQLKQFSAIAKSARVE